MKNRKFIKANIFIGVVIFAIGIITYVSNNLLKSSYAMPEMLKHELLSERIKNDSNINIKNVDGRVSYYYRGTTANNYLKFAGEDWRIVRLNEDGSIRIIKSSSIGRSEHDSNLFENGKIQSIINNWYINNLKNEYDKYVTTGNFCSNNAYCRVSMKTPTLS